MKSFKFIYRNLSHLPYVFNIPQVILKKMKSFKLYRNLSHLPYTEIGENYRVDIRPRISLITDSLL